MHVTGSIDSLSKWTMIFSICRPFVRMDHYRVVTRNSSFYKLLQTLLGEINNHKKGQGNDFTVLSCIHTKPYLLKLYNDLKIPTPNEDILLYERCYIIFVFSKISISLANKENDGHNGNVSHLM